MSAYLWDDAEWTSARLKAAYDAIEEIAVGEMGLDVSANQIEIINSEQMLDAYSSFGMPVFYKHWSFGKQFATNEQLYRRGMMGLAYEIVINSDPCISYLMEDNTMTMQALVIAHAAFGHNFVFKNNYMFRQWTDAGAILDYLEFASNYVAETERREGHEAVERFLDSCHALQSHAVDRYKRPPRISMEKEHRRQEERARHLQHEVSELYRVLPSPDDAADDKPHENRLPPQPEENILYFCEKHAPDLKTWQRELLRIIRKMAQYFYPQTLTKTINEGAATYTHYKIMHRLHEKGLMSDGSLLEFLHSHTSVVAQRSFDSPAYSGMNPYALGFGMFMDIERICTVPTEEDREWFPRLVGQDPLAVFKDAVANYRDESFVRQFLSPHLMRKMGLFSVLNDTDEPDLLVSTISNERGYARLRDSLADTYEGHTRAPQIEVVMVDRPSRELYLRHNVYRGRQLKDAAKMLPHLRQVWGYKVHLMGDRGEEIGSL